MLVGSLKTQSGRLMGGPFHLTIGAPDNLWRVPILILIGTLAVTSSTPAHSATGHELAAAIGIRLPPSHL